MIIKKAKNWEGKSEKRANTKKLKNKKEKAKNEIKKKARPVGQPTVPSIQGDSFQAPQQPRKPMMVTFATCDQDQKYSIDGF